MEQPIRASIKFGVGCFSFGIQKSPPFQLRGVEYVSQLQSALEKIPTISEINIEAESDFKAISLEVEKNIPKLDEDYGFFPPPSIHLEISFKLYIPARIQQQFDKAIEFASQPCEKFRVTVYSTYHFPVTFVELLEDTTEYEPSSGVVVVRKYLEKEFEKIDSELIRFESLGPSPFHADFMLCEDSENERENPHGFRCEIDQQRGYDDVTFYYKSKYCDTLANARDILFYELKDELSVFYRSVHSEVMQMHAWCSLTDRIQNVLSAQKQKSMFRTSLNLVRNYREIHDIAIELCQFEANELMFLSKAGKDLKDLFTDTAIPYLEPLLRKQIESPNSYPCSQIRDVLNLLEMRRSNLTGAIIVLISAIIGGVVGSLITLLAASS
jgi:hypothetical protein